MNMVEGSLDTTNLLLGILAAVSVVEVVLLIGIGVMVWRLYARANALMTSVDDVLTDVKGITSRVAQQAERLDSAIRRTVDHADETAGRVRRAVTARANRVIGVMRGVRVACDTFFARRTGSGRALRPRPIRGREAPKEE